VSRAAESMGGSRRYLASTAALATGSVAFLGSSSKAAPGIDEAPSLAIAGAHQ